MVLCFGVAGVLQVFMERRMGLDFFVVRAELAFFFKCLICFAVFLAIGIYSYVYVFIKAGLPSSLLSGSDE